MITFRTLVIAALCILPNISHAALMFSEIAWMGTDASADDEWIELFNHDFNVMGSGLNVDGWTLSDGNDINITLKGTIPPMTIIVFERTDDNSVPGVTAFQTYTGSLANTGETLTLRDAQGAKVAEVVGGLDWTSIGGRNTAPKKTPQQGMTGWVTGTPTPGAENIAHDETDTEEGQDTENNTNTNTQTSQRTINDNDSDGVRISLTPTDAALSLALTAPKTVYVNHPVTFSVEPNGIGPTLMRSLRYTWSFGDTYGGEGKEVAHTFTRTGEYVVVAEASYGRHTATARQVVKVLPVTVAVSRAATGDITLSNSSPEEIDLSGYVLKGVHELRMPSHTILLPGGSVTIDAGRVEDGVRGVVALYDGTRTMVASTLGMQPRDPLQQPTLAQPAPFRPVAVGASDVQGGAVAVAAAKTTTATTATATTSVPAVARGVSEVIPVGTAQSANVLASAPHALDAKLPYIGLIALILVGMLVLYVRGAGSVRA